jgi:hypothetical protein
MNHDQVLWERPREQAGSVRSHCDSSGNTLMGDNECMPVTVAVFDCPDNIHHPAKMFTMTKPFAYLSATVNAWKQPITLDAGEPLQLSYGVALWDGAVDKASVENLYQRWLALNVNDKPVGSGHCPNHLRDVSWDGYKVARDCVY